MSKSRDIADSAATINYIDNVTSDVQSQLNTLTTAIDNVSVTSGTLTKTFSPNESSTISLTSSVLAPVVSVTKEVPQTGVTNNNWDVSSTDENYEADNSAYSTTLDFTDPSLNNTSLSATLASEEFGEVTDIFLGDNGTKLYCADNTGDKIEQFNLSTAYDLSTASYFGEALIGAQETSVRGLAFKPDGTKMFIVGSGSDLVLQYSLSTAWDVTSATYDSVSFSTTGQTPSPASLAFNNDGTKMYFGGVGWYDVYEFDLSTAWDITTASYNLAFSVIDTGNSVNGFRFNSDGTNFYVSTDGITGSGARIGKYSLSSAYDLSTASFSNQLLYPTLYATASANRGVAVNQDESKLYFGNYTRDELYELNVAPSILTLGTGSFSSDDVKKTIAANDGKLLLTSTSGDFLQIEEVSSYNQVDSGDWSLQPIVYNALNNDLKLSSATSNIQNINATGSIYALPTGTQPHLLKASADGTKFFHVDPSTDTVYAHNLSTAWDITTASVGSTLSVSGQETNARGLQFNNDGTRVYVSGDTGDDINQYTLSTPYDLSTATFNHATSYAAQTSDGKVMLFNADGTKLYLENETQDGFVRYSLSSAYDTSTISYDGVDEVLPNFPAQNMEDGQFYDNGLILYIVSFDYISKYRLSTAYDISTAALIKTKFIQNITYQTRGVVVKYDDDSKIFVISNTPKQIAELDASLIVYSGYAPAITKNSIDTTYWTDINSMTADQAAGDGSVYYAISTDDRTTWTVIDNTDGERDIVRNNAGTWQYNSNATYALETWTNATTNTELATLAEAMEGASYLANEYDITTATLGDTFSVSAQSTIPSSVRFKSDGTKFYILGSGYVNEYNLSTAWDVTTASYSQQFYIYTQESTSSSLTFSADGTKFYVSGTTGDDVNEYTLSTAWDVSTASFVDSFSVAAQETNPFGICLSDDGTKLFVAGATGQDVNEYTLSTAWDVSTGSFVDSFSIASEIVSQPTDIGFGSSGTEMYVADYGSKVHQYTLSTAFDVSTSSYTGTYDLTGIEANPRGIAIKDGTQVFVVGSAQDEVMSFALGQQQATQTKWTRLN